MYSYSNKIRFIGIILFNFLYRAISVDSMRSVFLFHILKGKQQNGGVLLNFLLLSISLISEE
jgi:hypothetical protein